MTDERALLRAICEHPDEDTPRLMFADYLEENGDGRRAEFVRTQIEYAQTPPDSPLFQYTHWRHVGCVRRDFAYVSGLVPKFPGADLGNLVRGFVEDLHADDPRTLKAHAASIFGTFPVRSLRVRRLSEVALLADMPELRFVRRLVLLRCEFSLDNLRTLLESEHLTNLAAIDLDLNGRLGDAVVPVLADTVPNLPALRDVYLGGCNLTDAAAVWIGRERAFDQLRVIDLSYNLLTGAGGHELANATRLPNLTRLVLRGYRWPPPVQRHLRTRFTGVEL